MPSRFPGPNLILRLRSKRATVRTIVAASALLSLASLGRPTNGLQAFADDDAQPSGVDVFSFDFDDSRAFPGYNLMSPLNSNRTYLFDLRGRVVRTWESDCSPALCAYLLDNGHVLRGGAIGNESQVFGPGPGVGGRVQEFTWEGELVWDFPFYNARQIQHHDVAPLPNGNVLMIVWDRKTRQEALAAGRRPELTSDSHLLVDSLVEIRPTGKTTGEVVWEWHLWNHLVQDFDGGKPNYGNVAEHPELVDLNYVEDALAPLAVSRDAADKLKSVGYIGAKAARGRPRANPDWTHANSVAYNAALDQVVVSVHNFNEFWIIDHSTTTAEAAGHTGGRGGKGGDLLYRWGNPRAYRAGKKADQKLFGQHNAHWIDKGLPGEGHVLVFNNGGNRPDGSYSSVDELVLPVDSQGRYPRRPGAAYGPGGPVWSYTAPKKTDFYSFFISGAQRLPNGNTLICSGAEGVLFEVTPKKEVVWKFTNPVKGDRGPWGGFGPAPRPGQVLTPIVRALLAISPEQAAQLDAVQQDVDRRLAEVLRADQTQQLDEPQPQGPGRLGPSYQAGQVLAAADERRLNLSDEQQNELAALQKDVDRQLKKILTVEQRQQTQSGFALPDSVPDGAHVAGGPSRPGQPSPPVVQGASNSSDAMPVFRVYRCAANHAGLAGKNLVPGKTIEELEASEPDSPDRPFIPQAAGDASR
ncbi:MAG TPA: aryl-sulfate sulfotransferase [Pirellulales bacterium]|nr:aryl-sulfate sulfotransferase [Pirellulales bacterium]